MFFLWKRIRDFLWKRSGGFRDVADIAEMDIFFRATKISQPTKVNCDIRSGRCPWRTCRDSNPRPSA